MTQTETLHCPNCGVEQSPAFRAARMLTCTSCGTTLFLEPGGASAHGNAGDMQDVPLLIRLGQTVRLAGQDWQVVGHARYSYGRGWWDEFWALGAEEGVWISVDEGDVVLQHPVDGAGLPDTPPDLGAPIWLGGEEFRVVERDRAECLALRGSFPEVLEVGETYDFVNAQGQGGALLSGEFWPGGRSWFLGRWIDPFDVEPAP